jgi:hypothetical protein
MPALREGREAMSTPRDNLNAEQRELLSAYLDGELTAAESALARNLLERPEARVYLESLRRTAQLTRRHLEARAPVDFASLVVRNIADDVDDIGRSTNASRTELKAMHRLPATSWWAPYMAIAAAVVVAFGLIFGGGMLESRPDLPGEIARKSEPPRRTGTRDGLPESAVDDASEDPSLGLDQDRNSLAPKDSDESWSRPERRENGDNERAMKPAEALPPAANPRPAPSRQPDDERKRDTGGPDLGNTEDVRREAAKASPPPRKPESTYKEKQSPEPEGDENTGGDRPQDDPRENLREAKGEGLGTGGGGGGRRPTDDLKELDDARPRTKRVLRDAVALDRGRETATELSLELDRKSDPPALMVYSDVLRVGALYGEATLRAASGPAGEARAGKDLSAWDGVEISLGREELTEFAAALDRLASEQGFGKLILPEDLARGVKKSGRGESRGYLPTALDPAQAGKRVERVEGEEKVRIIIRLR